jgi:START domain
LAYSTVALGVWQGCVGLDWKREPQWTRLRIASLRNYKARAIICTAPRHVVELVMDSSHVGEYNKMSQGRNDILYIQRGIDTTADKSEYGIPGEAKIVKSLNKPPLIRRKIEMLSLIYARRLEQQADGYLVVSRSVWEDPSATIPQSLAKDTVRSEILLGVNLFRPIVGPAGIQYCEMTTITHTHASGVVPDALLRKMGAGQAAKVQVNSLMI